MTEYKSGKRPFSTSWRAVPYTNTFTYDGDENLVSKTDADNYTTQYTYNGLDMVTHINYNGGKQVDYAYNAVGDLVRMEDWTGVNTFEYDLLSQLKKVTDHKGNVVKYDYDGNGNQTAITYPDNSVVTYEYDGVNNLTSVTESDGRTTSYQYDGMRRVVRMDYPHGWVEEYEYDSIGQLLNVTDSDPSGKDMKQQKHVYRYDDCGNMVYEYMRGNGTGEATVENDYSYDALHRVIRAEEHYGHEVREYTYDSLGNLTYEESNTNYYVDYILNDLNQIVESSTDGWKTQTTYTYDGRGNLTEKVYGKNKKVTTVAEYVFDETNKLVLGYNALRESSEYTYNGLGALVTNTWVIAKNGYGYHDVDALVNGEELLNPDTLPNTPDLETELPETPDVTDDSTTEPETPDVTDQPATEPGTPDVTDQPATEPGTPDVTDQPAAEPGTPDVTDQPATEPGTPDVTDQPAAEPETPADPDTGIETAAVNNEGNGNDNGNPGKGHDKGNNGNKPAPDPDPSEPDVPETPSETKPGNNGNGNDGNGNSAGNNGQGNGNAAGNGDGNGSINKTSTVVKNFVVDYNTETFEPLMEHEVNGLDYKYVYGNDRLSVDISPINNSGKLIENGDHIRLYYHMDYLGTADYLTSPVSGKVEAWTHYNEWGLIVHNAVLKCGQRELDLVKRYATHDYDSVLELYYAKARFYDAHDRHFTAVDPILEPSGYDLREYVKDPVQLVQYLYVRDNSIVYIDIDGNKYILVARDSENNHILAKGELTTYGTSNAKNGYFHIREVADILNKVKGYSVNADYDENKNFSYISIEGNNGIKKMIGIDMSQIRFRKHKGVDGDSKEQNVYFKSYICWNQFQINYKALVNVSDLGSYLGIILEVYEEKNPGDLTYEQTVITGNYDLIAGYHDKDGNLSAWGTYVRVIGPNTNKGLTLGEIGAGIAEISGEYNVISWEFDAVTADAKAGLSWDYVGANVGARLISGGIGAKTIPIPFTNKSLYVGVEGELFGIGFATEYKDGKIKIKGSALIGGSLEFGLVDRKE